MNALYRILNRLYRKGCRSEANHHRLVTAFSLRCDEVPTGALLEATFDAFRPGDEKHPAMGLTTDVEGQQYWRFSVASNGVRVEHLSQGRRLAKDAALFAVLGSAAGRLFRLVHDLEMRRGLRALPDYLSETGGYAREVPAGRKTPLRGREIRLQVERPRWPAWLDRLFL